MLKRMLLAFSLFSITALSLAPALAQTNASNIVGVVTKVDSTMIEVRTDSKETMSIILGPATRYLKWIMAKPWQQDPRVDARFVHVGSRVHIEPSRDNPQTARTVWIVVGRPGFD